MTSPDILFDVDELTRTFRAVRAPGRPPRVVHAVREVSLQVRAGETLGLVGESGCGKSTLGRLMLRLDRPTSGTVHYRGQDLFGLSGPELLAFRRKAQIVFQDPFGSLNPRLTIGGALREVLAVHELAQGRAADDRIDELLDLVGLPISARRRYPHEFSGGQRQRIGIARALAVEPEFLLADEPVSALDVSVQAQVLNLLAELQDKLGLAYVLIAHDLAVVQLMSDRVAVMYLGRIVESGPTDRLFENPLHPYTKALIAAVPRAEVAEDRPPRERIILRGDASTGATSASGCAFYARCFHERRDSDCLAAVPPLRTLEADHEVRCLKV
ncbi:MAG: oligopeptide/dipeptide ABC transporter ATP-binding protein [Gemmatimonadota bacterium]